MPLLMALSAHAQHEQDFAERFMKLHAEKSSLQCTTVSPLMLERMMQLPDVKENEHMQQVLKQLKSIRMVHNVDERETQKLYDDALHLVTRNAARYKPYAKQQNKSLYVRKRGKIIVEMVLLMKHNKQLQLINLTGNMTEDFMKQLFGNVI